LRNRAFFDLKQFVAENHLTPVSAAYYYTEYQEGFSQMYPPHAFNKMELNSNKEVKEAGLVGDLVDDVGDIVDNLIYEDAYNDGYSYSYDYTYNFDYDGDTPDVQDIYDSIYDYIYDDIDYSLSKNRYSNEYVTTIYKSVTVNVPRSNSRRPGQTLTRTLSYTKTMDDEARITEPPKKKKDNLVSDILGLVSSVVDDILGVTINIGHGEYSGDEDENEEYEEAGIVINFNAADGTSNRIEIKQADVLDGITNDDLIKALEELKDVPAKHDNSLSEAESAVRYPPSHVFVYDQVSLLAEASAINSVSQ
jgi:hypothetical protein